MQLSSRKDDVDRMGKSHVVFAMLRTIGVYIENSGLDKLFSRCNIFDPVAAETIIDGKHISIPDTLSISEILFQSFLENDAELKLKVDEIAYSVMNRVADEPAYLPRAQSILTDQLKSLCLFKKFISF